jgi:hypothetical protein
MIRFLVAISVFIGTSSALAESVDLPAKQAEAASKWPPYEPRCTQQECEKIKRGMRVRDVAAILRCPPGDYTSGKGVYAAFIDPFPVRAVRYQYSNYWCGRQSAIGLALDQNGRVKRADWFPAVDP